MFNYYLPESIYRQLPLIYLLAALALALLPLGTFKWLSVGALMLAAGVTRRRRRRGRSHPLAGGRT